MLYDDAAEIVQLVKDKEEELDLLYQRMEDDFNLLTLVPYEPKDSNGKVRKGYASYTTSAPKTFFTKTLDGLNRAALSIQIKLPEDAKKKDRDAASTGELYIFGALHAIDRRFAAQGEPPLREAMDFIVCLRGWIALRALVYLPKGKTETVFDVQVWDLLNTTWESGPDGLLWAANKRVVSKAQILAEYGVTIEGKTGTLIDFWNTENNSVIIDGTFLKEPEVHGIAHTPVHIGSVGSMPTLQGRSETSYSGNNAELGSMIEHRGDSVWAQARGLYEPKNRQISVLMDIQERASVGSMVHISDSVDKIDGDPFGTFRIIPLKPGETLEPLRLPQSPIEAGVILGVIEDDMQQAALPFPLAYGGTEQALSGRALAYLGDQTKSVYSPRTGTVAVAYTWLCEELLHQFAEKGTKTTEMQGFGKNEQFFRATIKPKDINPNWYIEVKIEPRLPRDEAADIQMALQATSKQGPDSLPLVSQQTARSDMLQLRDPDSELDRILFEQGQAIPPVIAARVIEAMSKAGDTEGVAFMLAWMERQGLAPPPAPGAGPTGQPPTDQLPTEESLGTPTIGPAAPGQAQQPGQETPQVQVMQAVLETLNQIGASQIAEALVVVLQSGQPIPDDLLAAVLQVLADAGADDLAQAMFDVAQAMAGGQPGPA